VSDIIDKLRERGKNEPVASFLEMKLLELSEGFARVSMQMKPEYLNFNGTVFGGIISAVADQAFAYATNSLSVPNVATQFNIHFLSAVRAQDVLTAECRVVKPGRRICISEIKVFNQENKAVAMATGTTVPLPDGL
jgi:acyl-CoA thioesterase